MGANTAAQVKRDQLDSVKGEIGFVPRTSREGPTYEVSGYVNQIVSHEVSIRDARPIVDKLSLDREGFILVNHAISSLNESDPRVMTSKYVEEMASFLKSHFNASWVVPYAQGGLGAAIHRSADAAKVAGATRGRARVAHIDFSPKSAPVIAALSDQANGFRSRSYSRMMLIQTWCALSPAPQDFPLALVDGSTVVDTDIVEDCRTDPSVDIESALWLLQHSPGQHWYYFSDMKPNEFILFKGYDSEDYGNPRSAHTAFDNRRAFPDATPRESIETRFFVYFK
nr:CmcJ/NvfI family oxidoreductase [Bradyrhizobium sp. Oc8]